MGSGGARISNPGGPISHRHLQWRLQKFESGCSAFTLTQLALLTSIYIEKIHILVWIMGSNNMKINKISQIFLANFMSLGRVKLNWEINTPFVPKWMSIFEIRAIFNHLYISIWISKNIQYGSCWIVLDEFYNTKCS